MQPQALPSLPSNRHSQNTAAFLSPFLLAAVLTVSGWKRKSLTSRHTRPLKTNANWADTGFFYFLTPAQLVFVFIMGGWRSGV